MSVDEFIHATTNTVPPQPFVVVELGFFILTLIWSESRRVIGQVIRRGFKDLQCSESINEFSHHVGLINVLAEDPSPNLCQLWKASPQCQGIDEKDAFLRGRQRRTSSGGWVEERSSKRQTIPTALEKLDHYKYH
jgi:hypothetical protein